jgi:hypothetical protein
MDAKKLLIYEALKPPNAIDRYITKKALRKKTIYHLTQKLVYTGKMSLFKKELILQSKLLKNIQM